MKVTVAIESEQFRDGLGETKRKAIESAVASALVAEFAKPFPIIEWRANAGADVPVATLTAAVIERRTNPDPNSDPEIDLVWRARSASSEFDMPGISVTVLYRASIVDRPVDDSGSLFTEALRNAAVSWVNSQTNQKDLNEKFLKHVLIANRVMAADMQFVVVPLAYQNVKMRRDSVLHVKYRDGATDGTAQKEFTLTGIVPRLSEPLNGGTQTHIGSCVLGGQPVPDDQRWAKCVAPLGVDPPKVVSVYADPYIYEAHPDVESGVIVEE